MLSLIQTLPRTQGQVRSFRVIAEQEQLLGKETAGAQHQQEAPYGRGPHFCPRSCHPRCTKWVYRLVDIGVSVLHLTARCRVVVPSTLSHISLWAGRERKQKGSSSHHPAITGRAQCIPTLPTDPYSSQGAACTMASSTHWDRRRQEAPQPHAADSRTNLA